MESKDRDRRIPSVSATRLALIIGVPLAVVFAHHASAWATVAIKTWIAGDTLTATDLNASFTSIKNALASERVSSAIITGGTGNVVTAVATCPAGKTVIGGGCIFDTVSDTCCMQPLEGYPNTTSTYTCKVFNTAGSDRSIQAFAICAGF